MVKTFKNLLPEPEDQWLYDLVCSIWDVGPSKLVQIMILGWQGQIYFLLHFKRNKLEKLIFQLLLNPKLLYLLDICNLSAKISQCFSHW